MNKHRKLLAATSLIAVISLAGCWNDDDDSDEPGPPAATTEVPDSAGVSGAALLSFILGLNASDEASEPLTIKDTFAVPADESAEPATLG